MFISAKFYTIYKTRENISPLSYILSLPVIYGLLVHAKQKNKKNLFLSFGDSADFLTHLQRPWLAK